MIILNIVKQKLMINRPHVVADSINYLELKAHLSDDWNSLTTFVCFENGDKSYKVMLDDDDEITKDKGLNLGKGVWKVYCYGGDFENGELIKRITTNVVTLEVIPTGNMDGEPFPEFDPSTGEKYIAKIEKVIEDGKQEVNESVNLAKEYEEKSKESAEESARNLQELKDKIASGEFKGDPGEVTYIENPYDDSTIREEIENLEKESTEIKEDFRQLAETVSDVNRRMKTVELELVDHNGRIYRLEQEIGQMDMENLNFEQMIENISTGNGKNFYPVGDQLLVNYNYNGVDYECPYNIVEHGSDVILDDEENEVEVPSMSIEWEYTIPNGLAFDTQEAMYVAPESGLPAGTYHFKVDGDSWNSENGKTFQFTLTEPLTDGMHLRPTKNYNVAFAGTNMCAYTDGKSTTALQTVKITEGSEGVDLGTIGSGDLNHYHRIFLGYNRWSQSLYRQWLNSEGTGWWTPQNKFDRAPSNVDSLVGFLSNIPEEFRSVLKPVKLQTYRNTVTDDGGIDVTYDKVFLLSFANWNNESNSSIQSPGNGVEGDAYEYYRRLAEGVENLSAKGNFRIWQTYPILIRYALNAKTSAQYVFSRSASRAYGNHVLGVNTSGTISYTYASNGNRCRPACKICGNPPSHASAE